MKLFDSELLRASKARKSELKAIRSAVLEGTICAFYQPKVDLCTGRLVGLEALLRSGDGQLSSVAMGQALADHDLATRISQMLHRQVARDIKRWSARHASFGRISINAAASEFLRDDFAQRLLGILQVEGVAPEQIGIEVTEETLMGGNAIQVLSALRMLRDAKVHISLDDFGTGSSSLTRLPEWPVDELKIDASLVAQVPQDQTKSGLVVSLASLADTLNLDLVGEGIETPAQEAFLRSAGCKFGQGFLYGHPLSSKACESRHLNLETAQQLGIAC